MNNKQVEVMFWNQCNEAILFGTQSKFYFNDRQEAFNFISNIEVLNCTEISIDGDIFSVLNEEE